MKKIYIMRHGQATAMCANDASRNLTNDGIAEVTKISSWLANRVSIDAVLVSPYIRAQQTLDLMRHNQTNIQFEQISTDFLPEASPAQTCDFLQALISLNSEYKTWLVVAHMPLVSYLVGEFCQGKMPIFNTGSIACIEYDELNLCGELVFLKSPQKI
ncbi:phosphohistidine phosphatase SixA [Pseudoalteromonas denitrificans]|uniref:Phosphohistidine phosphatase, SixA n=1 Tax=Pseudoalteromonas denitrificans DSM 6059 TaxID=1123010 RepID=A0A1I1PY57_9GAMM|nr:phosphohistidine phosphatase SixA [Pseudoalteromonas denitrificans]SFD10840.1 phosphohistidine phosphatase, SixA [Pseudoalteromonas denitrificans DSM 6059]